MHEEPGDLGDACGATRQQVGGRGKSHTARTYVRGVTQRILPMNHSNKDGKPSAESAEGRAADQGERT